MGGTEACNGRPELGVLRVLFSSFLLDLIFL